MYTFTSMDNDQREHLFSFDSQKEIAPADSQKKLKKNPKFKALLGVFALVTLLAGGLISLYLTQINQDIRQQASVGDYECEPSYHSVNGQCVPTACDDPDGDGIIVCGIGNGECTEDSLGGDWCDNPNTPEVDTCSDGMIRCKCGPGNDQGYWVIGVAESCSDLCEDAEVICTDCPPGDGGGGGEPDPTEPPITRNTPTPTIPPRITPTVTPTPPPGTPTPSLTPTNTPAPTNTPTPTATLPPGPQCRNIEMWDVTNGTGTSITGNGDSAIVPGETTVRFTCSNFQADPLPSGYFYAFRIFEPCGSDNHLTPLEFINEEGENGVNYDIEMSGDYQAQCSVCTVDSSGDTVCDWESLTPSSCE